MKKVSVKFASVDEIIRFVDIVKDYKSEVDLKEGHIVVDAKSLLGVMNFGTEKKLDMIILNEKCKDLLDKIDFCIVA